MTAILLFLTLAVTVEGLVQYILSLIHISKTSTWRKWRSCIISLSLSAVVAFSIIQNSFIYTIHHIPKKFKIKFKFKYFEFFY